MFEFKKTSLQQRRRMLLRALVAGVFALIGLCVLGARLWYLQVERYEGLAARADQNRIADLGGDNRPHVHGRRYRKGAMPRDLHVHRVLPQIRGGKRCLEIFDGISPELHYKVVQLSLHIEDEVSGIRLRRGMSNSLHHGVRP